VLNPVDRVWQMRAQARLYASRLDAVAKEFVARDEVIRVIGLATLCREHVLLIGPPGTAKTAVIDAFLRVLKGTRHFSYLLTRFTEPAELYGPLDVEQFNRGTFRYHTEGMLPKAHLAFLDEVFSGSSAILNTLLALINERVFYNGPERQTADLHTLLGSTNGLPTDPLLAAFGDRFLLRCKLDYVGPDQLGKLLETGWRHEQRLVSPGQADGQFNAAQNPDLERFPLSKLEELQQEVTQIGVSEVRPLLATVLRTLAANGVRFSDRRAVKAQKMIAASALLAGRREAVREDLGVLAYLWTQEGDDKTIRDVLTQEDVPIDLNPRLRRESSTITFELRELTRGTRGTTSAEREDLVQRLRLLREEAEDDHPDDTELRGEIEQAYTAALAALSDEREGAVDHV